jgi:GTPase
MVHCGPIRQTARILNMDRDVLRTGDRATVIFQFLVRPEYIIPGTKLIFREGKTKGIGKSKSFIHIFILFIFMHYF